MAASDDLEAWDRVASTYAEVVGSKSDSIYKRFQPFLSRHLGVDLSGLRLLDLGCGHGWLAEICRARGSATTIFSEPWSICRRIHGKCPSGRPIAARPQPSSVPRVDESTLKSFGRPLAAAPSVVSGSRGSRCVEKEEAA